MKPYKARLLDAVEHGTVADVFELLDEGYDCMSGYEAQERFKSLVYKIGLAGQAGEDDLGKRLMEELAELVEQS